MKNFVVFVFALAVAASLLAACNATPCGASDWYQPAVIPLPDVGLASSIGWGPWVGNYVGSVALGHIPLELDDLWPRVAACSQPDVGTLLEEVLQLIGIQNSQCLSGLPVHITSAPLNIGDLQAHLGSACSAYPGAPCPLSTFTQSLSGYLAQQPYCASAAPPQYYPYDSYDYSYGPYNGINAIPIPIY